MVLSRHEKNYECPSPKNSLPAQEYLARIARTAHPRLSMPPPRPSPFPVFLVGTTVLVVALFAVGWLLRRSQGASHDAAPPTPTAPPYDPAKYTSNPYVQNSHNCYAYALDFYDPALAKRCQGTLRQGTRKTCFTLRPKPGRVSNTHQDLPYSHRMTCGRILEGILQDVPSATVTTRDAPCPEGHYKIAFAVDPHRTYHFYRQDADGAWSHKDAWRPVTRVDASGMPIADPAQADRKYPHADLSEFCAYVCVPAQAYLPTFVR